MSSPASVMALAARFRLRARARRSAYLSGRALADANAVDLVGVDADVVVANVNDRTTYTVTIRRVSKDVTVTCSCETSARQDVCRHAVAVEHVLWKRTVEPPP